MKTTTKLTALILLSLLYNSIALAQWTKKVSSTTQGLEAMKFINPTTGVACGWFNTIVKTSDGGNTWQSVNNSSIPSATYLSIDALSANSIFVARNGLFVTENGGTTWNQWGSYNSSAYAIHSIKAINDSSAFITKGGYILKTSNKGSRWDAVYYYDYLTGPMLFTGNNDTAYAVSGRTWDGISDGTIHRSIDGGDTWTNLNLTSKQILAIYFRSSRIGYYVDFENAIYRTADAGSTWTSINSPLANQEDHITGLLFSSDSLGYATTANGFIYKTSNGGMSWRVDHAGHQTNGVYDTYLRAPTAINNKDVVAIGDLGTVLKNDGTLSIPKTGVPTIRAYPNPVSKELTIDMGTKTDYERLTIYDVTGKVVYTGSIRGVASLRVDMHPLAPGLYVVELCDDSQTYRLKVVKN